MSAPDPRRQPLARGGGVPLGPSLQRRLPRALGGHSGAGRPQRAPLGDTSRHEASYIVEINLSGQRAIVTGASTGIGRATAIALAEAGADVAVHYGSSRHEAEETARPIESHGRRAVIVTGGFRDPESTLSLLQAAVSQPG